MLKLKFTFSVFFIHAFVQGVHLQESVEDLKCYECIGCLEVDESQLVTCAVTPSEPEGDNPEDNQGDNPGNTPGDNPEENPEDNPADSSDESPDDNPGENSGDNPGENPDDNPGDSSEDNPELSPGDNPGDSPEGSPEVNPDDNPGESPGDSPEDNQGNSPGDNEGDSQGDNPGQGQDTEPADNTENNEEGSGNEPGYNQGNDSGQDPGTDSRKSVSGLEELPMKGVPVNYRPSPHVVLLRTLKQYRSGPQARCVAGYFTDPETNTKIVVRGCKILPDGYDRVDVCREAFGGNLQDAPTDCRVCNEDKCNSAGKAATTVLLVLVSFAFTKLLV